MQKCFVRSAQLSHWVHQVEHRTQAGDKREIQLGPRGPGPPAPQHPARQACPGADLWSLFISFSHFSGLWSLTQVCPIPCFRQEGRAERPLKASGPWHHSSSNRCGLPACFLLGRRPEQQGGGAPHVGQNGANPACHPGTGSGAMGQECAQKGHSYSLLDPKKREYETLKNLQTTK